MISLRLSLSVPACVWCVCIKVYAVSGTYVVCTTLVMTATAAAHQSVRKSELAVRGRDCDIPKLGPGMVKSRATGVHWRLGGWFVPGRSPNKWILLSCLLWVVCFPSSRAGVSKDTTKPWITVALRTAVRMCLFLSTGPSVRGGFGLGCDGTDSFVLTRRARCRTGGKIMVSR
jgi:hypothetical protein